jgi:hypothetical protein
LISPLISVAWAASRALRDSGVCRWPSSNVTWSARTSAGLAAARARGRPSAMTAPKLQVAREMYASNQDTVAAIAKTLG